MTPAPWRDSVPAPTPSAAAADPAEASAEAVALVDHLCRIPLAYRASEAEVAEARARVLAHVAAVERKNERLRNAAAELRRVNDALDEVPESGGGAEYDDATRVRRLAAALAAERARGEAQRDEAGRISAALARLLVVSPPPARTAPLRGAHSVSVVRDAIRDLQSLAARPSAPPPAASADTGEVDRG